jgi:Gluconate 2-dehydrogenase subunit 3
MANLSSKKEIMLIKELPQDSEYILNHCAKFISREAGSVRHSYVPSHEEDEHTDICERWRFPLIDTYWDAQSPEEGNIYNRVTFIYIKGSEACSNEIYLMGNFAPLYTKFMLKPVYFQQMEMPYFSITLLLPKGRSYLYKFIVSNKDQTDQINPQKVVLDSGQWWSRFFTDYCAEPLSLRRTEVQLLAHLTEYILPLRSQDKDGFLERYYTQLDQLSKRNNYEHTFRLDQSVGIVNFIDKLLTKQESHHLVDYRICLSLIDRILWNQFPALPSEEVPESFWADLCQAMARNQVEGWDYQEYKNPAYFLTLLRRHTFTGAFTHPKYGGNVGAAGWAYLEDRYRNEEGSTLFAWREAMEHPLGNCTVYRG